MSSKFVNKKLGEVCEFQRGLTYSKKDEVEYSRNVVLRANNIDEATSLLDFSDLRYISEDVQIPENKKVRKGSLIICTASGSKSHLGKIAFIDQDYDYAFGGFMGMITSKNEVESSWLYYILLSERYKKFISELSSGVNINNLKFNDLKFFEIPVPPIAEQRRIVRILDEVFEGIKKVKENTEKNLQNSKELFESCLNSIFSNPGKDWERRSVGDAIIKTETINPSNDPLREFIYIDVSSVNRENFNIEVTTKMRGKDAPSRARKLVRSGDILFATIRPTLKRVAIVPLEYDGQVCSTGYLVLRARKEINNKFLFYALLTGAFNKRMEKLQRGASYPAVSDGDVKGFVFSYPRLRSRQDSIIAKLDTLSEQTKKLEAIYKQKLADLEELKKSVLKKAFSGEL